jgi:thymidylate synthase (FAD)
MNQNAIQEQVTLIDHMGDDLSIVNAARKSFDRTSHTFNTSDKKLLRYLYENKHTSPFEFVEFTFLIKCPIPIAKQWMRHRTWSYNEISRRYTEVELDYYTPKPFRKQSTDNKQGSIDEAAMSDQDYNLTFWKYQSAIKACFDTYQALLNDGVCREQARFVLPQATYTEFYAKTDLSNLLKFISLRVDTHAQWEMQQYAKQLLKLIEPIVPHTVELFKEGINID